MARPFLRLQLVQGVFIVGFLGLLGRAAQVQLFQGAEHARTAAAQRTERVELELSGSLDGRVWESYRFRYKPGDPAERPAIVLPHQPRLDWEMWFVSQHPKYMRFFHNFLQALLDNSPAVTALLRHNPFTEQPPRYIRVEAYKYRFSTPQERQKTGQWWQREALGAFTPLPWVEAN